jgi:hypothetical protein
MYAYGLIKDYDNYVIRNDGVVIKISDKREMKNGVGNQGYLRLTLTNEGKHKTLKLHRLLGKAFIDGEDATHNTIDHIDRNKLNNSLDNLRWATKSEQNINKEQRPSKTGEQYITLKKQSLTYQVQIRLNRKTVYMKNFKTMEEAIIGRDEFNNKY